MLHMVPQSTSNVNAVVSIMKCILVISNFPSNSLIKTTVLSSELLTSDSLCLFVVFESMN